VFAISSFCESYLGIIAGIGGFIFPNINSAIEGYQSGTAISNILIIVGKILSFWRLGGTAISLVYIIINFYKLELKILTIPVWLGYLTVVAVFSEYANFRQSLFYCVSYSTIALFCFLILKSEYRMRIINMFFYIMLFFNTLDVIMLLIWPMGMGDLLGNSICTEGGLEGDRICNNLWGGHWMAIPASLNFFAVFVIKFMFVKKNVPLFLFSFAICMAQLKLCASGTALLCMALMVFASIIVYLFHKQKWLMSIFSPISYYIAGFALTIAIAFFKIQYHFEKQLEDWFDRDPKLSGREQLFSNAVWLFEHNWVFGSGESLSAPKAVAKLTENANFPGVGESQSGALDIIFFDGIIGLLIFIICIWQVSKSMQMNRTKLPYALLGVVALGYSFDSVTGSGLWSSSVYIFFAVSCAAPFFEKRQDYFPQDYFPRVEKPISKESPTSS
jgi:hypothetical protein